MQKRLPRLMGATMLTLLMLSFLGAVPAFAACGPRAGECLAPPYAVPAEPVWATLNAFPQGNYPGGNLEFRVFVINSAQPPSGNVTLMNETLTAAALPPGQNTSVATGLPVNLARGQAITSTIALHIPSDFAQTNFTANLVVVVLRWNGTINIPIKLTGSALVYLLGAPAASSSTTTSSTSSTTPQSGGISTGLFAAGVAIPSIVAVILLVLLVRRGGGPKGGT